MVQMPSVDASDIESTNYYPIHSTTDTTYEATISKPWSINKQPWGTVGAEPISNYTQYVGEKVSIKQEKVTDKATYALISINGNELGWIDTTGLSILTVYTTTDVYYTAEITLPCSINTEPWGTRGYLPIENYQQYVGSQVEVTQEKQTQRATYAYMLLNGNPLGWIDKSALTEGLFVTSRTPVQYEAEVTLGWSINTEPWGTPGAAFIDDADYLVGEQVSITEEAVTPKASYALIVSNGKEIGWIDTGAINPLVINQVTDKNYSAKIIAPWSINTEPWGTYGYQEIKNYESYNGQDVEVIKEAVTRRSTYTLLTYNGSTLGWMDIGALEPYISITASRTINYEAKLTKPWSINTQPWGTKGFEPTVNSADYVDESVTVTEEKVTPKATYSLISLGSQQLGWVDKGALEVLEVQTTKDINYAGILVNPWALTNVPWGTANYYNVYDSNEYLGKEVTVSQEKVTQKATYAYITSNGTPLGWIDKTALDVYRVTNTKDVNYRVDVLRPWTINTSPWGTEGFTTIPNYASYVGERFKVTEEKITSRGATYLLLTLNGSTLGWIEATGVSDPIETKIVYIDPGHGGTDSGAHYFGVQEKTINLQVSKKIQKLLEDKDYEVIMSRTTDKAIDYKTERSEMVNSSDADIFVSVHHNAMPGNAGVHGIETFYYKYDPDFPSKINETMHNNPERVIESGKLVAAIHDELISNTGAVNRGVRRETFAVLRETAIPAVLLELGFMSNRAELNKLTMNSYQDILANAVVNGIDNYFKQ